MSPQRYYEDVEHRGLHRFQRISGPDRYVVQARAAAKRAEWDRLWKKRCEASKKASQRQASRDAKALAKEEQRAYLEARKQEAMDATAEAERAVAAVEGILAHTLQVDDRVDFESLKSSEPFPEARPTPPKPLANPIAPQPVVRQYLAPTRSWWEQLLELVFAARRERRVAAEEAAAADLQREQRAEDAQRRAAWQRECQQTAATNQQWTEAYEAQLASWSERRNHYLKEQEASNASVDSLKQRYLAGEPDAVEQYQDMVLSASSYPESFPNTFRVRYDAAAATALVEMVLPLPEHVPTVKSVKYTAIRDELTESRLPEATVKKLYDNAIYQIVLRTLHELFEADVVNALKAVAFNGVVETRDPATGKDIRPCIVSVQASKAEFSEIALEAVDAKACFRKLKGVGSAQLHALSPIAPVIRFNTDDIRFVDSRAVMDGVDAGSNLAAMPWEEFEYLIRDLFEREFASGGAEVKVTRASRDGGVDAVVFDPDPIRGGKFLIQAKRYTNTVGVAAVRDLYGAMTHERASRGILVATSDYGYDSYEFAKDKSITLITGSNLLSMLQKHGVRARIDLAEAKVLNSEQRPRG